MLSRHKSSGESRWFVCTAIAGPPAPRGLKVGGRSFHVRTIQVQRAIAPVEVVQGTPQWPVDPQARPLPPGSRCSSGHRSVHSQQRTNWSWQASGIGFCTERWRGARDLNPWPRWLRRQRHHRDAVAALVALSRAEHADVRRVGQVVPDGLLERARAVPVDDSAASSPLRMPRSRNSSTSFSASSARMPRTSQRKFVAFTSAGAAA